MTDRGSYIAEMGYRYTAYIKSDLGFLKLSNKKFNVINSNIPDHLSEICAFIRTYYTQYGSIFDPLVDLYTDLFIKYKERISQDIPDEPDLIHDLYDIWSLAEYNAQRSS